MIREHDEELRAEQDHVADLHARLDAERARVGEEYRAALLGTGGSPMERDVQVRASAGRLRRLDVADDGLCFGRLDGIDGGRSYIGRIGLRDEDDEPVLLDWRAPASRAFYVATAAHPENVRRRRQFHTRGRRVLDFTDEVLGRPGAGEQGDSALLAAIDAPRGEGMRDIVATIQAEQDEVIRLDHPGVVVIEGGPGTGKTVVALHRVAYLLYTQRERMERHGVLVVGPNRAFLHHVGRVLPSLGESDVVFSTTGEFIPGLRVTADDTPGATASKGALAALDVLAAAIAGYQQLPERPRRIAVGDVGLEIDAETARWARDEARASGRPHNQARAVFAEVLTYVLTERAATQMGKGWIDRRDRATRQELIAELRIEVAGDEAFARLVDDLWPVLTPETLLAGLFSSVERLRAAGADPSWWRADGTAWTVPDVPLLDELTDLLGPDPDAARTTDLHEQERRQEADYADRVLEGLALDDEEKDEDLGLSPENLLQADELAGRFVEEDTRGLVERATSDRDWTYRHIVVDEAQELSEMEWRVLMRRCPGRSFTVVGDLAQRRSPAGARSWAAMLERYVPGRWAYRSLTVNYRTPAEIMAVAAELLAEFAPDVVPPESVRSTGVPPWTRKVDGDEELQAVIAEFRHDEAGREGTSTVIGPPGTPNTVPPSETKGLEFDAVLVVDPDGIRAQGPRGVAELYVALTRATQRLGQVLRS